MSGHTYPMESITFKGQSINPTNPSIMAKSFFEVQVTIKTFNGKTPRRENIIKFIVLPFPANAV
jgi:hypothetical protein